MARKVDPARQRAARERIREAATVLFATRGFDGTSTAEISKGAGMSTGNLFHYYPSKRDVFVAVVTDGEQEKAAMWAAARDSNDSWRALLDVVELMVEPTMNPLGPPLAMEAMLQAQRDPELAARLRRDEEEEQAALETLVARSIADGSIDPGLAPREAASWIRAIIGALYLRAVTDDKPSEAATARLETLRLLLHRFLRAATPIERAAPVTDT